MAGNSHRPSHRKSGQRQRFVVLVLFAVALAVVIWARLSPTEPGKHEGLHVGQTAPQFTLPNALGGEVSLADYQGKQPVLVYFSMGHG